MVPNNVYVPIFTSFVGKKEKKTNCDYFLFGLSKKRVTSTSVSYTHLDVYKRQD